MRRKTTQYFAVIFCLLVIGQDFCSGRIADEIIKGSKAKREAIHEQHPNADTGNPNTEIKELTTTSRKKRSAATILFATAFLISLGSVGFQLYLAHENGCCTLYQSICKAENRFNEFKGKLKDLSDEIDLTYLDAENLFEWAQNINYRVQEMWLKVEKITSLNDQIVEGINPNIITQLETISKDIEDEIEAKNETTLAYTNADLNLRYTTVWDDTTTALQTGFYLASYPLSLLAQRLINYMITRSIAKFASTLSVQYGTILHNSLAGNGKAASFFGVRSAADVDVNVYNTAKAVQSAKYSKTATWGPKIVDGLTIVTSLATIGLEAWSLYQTWSDCEKLLGKVDEAADDVEEAYYDNVDLNTTVTDYFDNITYYYNDIREQLTSDDFDVVLEEIKNITLFAADADRMKQATDAIDEWFLRIDDATESETYDLLETLNDGLANVSYTLECYRNKYRAITYVSEKCASGDDSLENLYASAEQSFFLNDQECIDDSGYKYTTFEDMKAIIEGLAESEGYNSDCILSSETVAESVCLKYWDGHSNESIMEDLSLNQEQLDFFLADCGEKPLDPATQERICSLIDKNSTGIFTVDFIASLYGLTEDTVETALENCAEESTTTDSFQETTTPEPTTTEATTTTEPTTTRAPTTTEATTTTPKATAVVVSSSRRRRRRRRRRWI